MVSKRQESKTRATAFEIYIAAQLERADALGPEVEKRKKALEREVNRLYYNLARAELKRLGVKNADIEHLPDVSWRLWRGDRHVPLQGTARVRFGTGKGRPKARMDLPLKLDGKMCRKLNREARSIRADEKMAARWRDKRSVSALRRDAARDVFKANPALADKVCKLVDKAIQDARG